MTSWTITSSNGRTTYDARHLLQILMSKKPEDGPQAELVSALGEFCSKTLMELTFGTVLGIAFHLGYTYRVFLEKNKVQINVESNSNESPV